MATERIDVLAVMDRGFDLLESGSRTDASRRDALLRELYDARSAVAELIEAAGAYLSLQIGDSAECIHAADRRFRAAYSRVGGA